MIEWKGTKNHDGNTKSVNLCDVKLKQKTLNLYQPNYQEVRIRWNNGTQKTGQLRSRCSWQNSRWEQLSTFSNSHQRVLRFSWSTHVFEFVPQYSSDRFIESERWNFSCSPAVDAPAAGGGAVGSNDPPPALFDLVLLRSLGFGEKRRGVVSSYRAAGTSACEDGSSGAGRGRFHGCSSPLAIMTNINAVAP